MASMGEVRAVISQAVEKAGQINAALQQAADLATETQMLIQQAKEGSSNPDFESVIAQFAEVNNGVGDLQRSVSAGISGAESLNSGL